MTGVFFLFSPSLVLYLPLVKKLWGDAKMQYYP
jgi:hypothetical protein